jgi:HEAT repeat protein
VGNSPLRSLAITALCERRDERYETLVRSLLGSTDVETRSAAALGLARNRDPAATGLLVGAYEFEEVADVRLAVVIGLSQRDAGRARDDVLSSARDTDVDARVRSAARLALSGQRLSPWPVGDEVAWVTIPEGPVPAWLVVSASGAPSLPIPTGGQRLLPVLGVQSAGVGVRLAPGGAPGDDGS